MHLSRRCVPVALHLSLVVSLHAGPAPCGGDVTGDGITDFEDLSTLLDDWVCLSMYGWEGTAPGESLKVIDTSVPRWEQVGPAQTPELMIISEIEHDGVGVIWAVDTGNNTLLHRIDASTGEWINTMTMSLPPEGNVITAMEFVDGVLYAGLTTEGGGVTVDTWLSIIDTVTGEVSVVGEASGVGSPMGGLAWNGAALYGLSSGGSPPTLFTLDINTGVASEVAPVMLDGASPGNMTALEFGPNGVLYALPSRNNPLVNHLLSIDSATGIAADIGNMGGIGRMVALTTGEPCEGDANGDNTTNFFDLNDLLDAWGCGL